MLPARRVKANKTCCLARRPFSSTFSSTNTPLSWHFLFTFSPASFAIRLRSSVVSVLVGLIAEMVPTGAKMLDYSTLWRSPAPLPWLAWRDEWHRVRGFTLLPCDANLGGFCLFHHCLDFGTLEKDTLNFDCNEDKKSIKCKSSKGP